MSPVYLGRGDGRQALDLGALLGEGASGKVHALPRAPGLAAKLYHSPAEARKYEAKIEAMLARRPDLPALAHNGQSYAQLAWPEAKLFDRAGMFVGFTMPEIDFGRSTSLVNLLQKSSRRIEKIPEYYGYRVLVARNLASVFAELHRAGHHMIDMKPANLRFYPAVSWMAVVDADGFSIAGRHGRIPASQLSDEYIAPESWKQAPASLGIEQDLFALAAIIFQLLNNGVHPFAGTTTGAGATDLQGRIVEGLYPYALSPPPGLVPATASIHRMFPRATRSLFDAAFGSRRRPSAAQWRDHLDALIASLSPCAAKPGDHAHFGQGCGFCGHEARVGATRARPRPRRVPAVPAAAQISPALRPLPPLPPLPLTHVVARRRRRRSPVGAVVTGVLWAGVAGLLGIAAYLSDDLRWRGLLVPAEVQAATLAVPGAAEPGYADSLGDYSAVPDTDPHGAGTAPVAGRCPEGKICVDRDTLAGERALGDRYRALLRTTDSSGRHMLGEIHGLWEQERTRCYEAAEPAACRRGINAAQMRDLADWEAIEKKRADSMTGLERP